LSKFFNGSEISAYFGGTFDPPHLGHLEAAQGLLINPGVKEVIFLPSGNPPWKTAAASPEHRIAMLRLMSNLRIDETEIDLSRRNPHLKNTTFQTLQILKQKTPRLAFVIGLDQLLELDRWSHFPELLKICPFICLLRDSASIERARNGLLRLKSITGQTELPIHVYPTPAGPYSSTQIRKEIAITGTPSGKGITRDVKSYLIRHALYGSSTNNNDD
jgi:nicotinate-nucleotide adenylyltransferase